MMESAANMCSSSTRNASRTDWIHALVAALAGPWSGLGAMGLGLLLGASALVLARLRWGGVSRGKEQACQKQQDAQHVVRCTARHELNPLGDRRECRYLEMDPYEEAYLRLGREYGGAYKMVLALDLDVDHPVTKSQVRNCVRVLQRRHGILRCRVVRSRVDPDCLLFEESLAYDIPIHVVNDATYSSVYRERIEHINVRHGQEHLVEVFLILCGSSPLKPSLLISMDHCVGLGDHLLNFADDLLALLAAHPQQQEVDVDALEKSRFPNPPPVRAFPPTSSFLIRSHFPGSPWRQRLARAKHFLSIIFHALSTMPWTKVRMPQADPNYPVRAHDFHKRHQTLHVHRVLSPDQSKKLLATCRANGVTITAAMGGVCAQAFEDLYRPKEGRWITMSFSVNVAQAVFPQHFAERDFHCFSAGMTMLALPSSPSPASNSSLLFDRARLVRSRLVEFAKYPTMVGDIMLGRVPSNVRPYSFMVSSFGAKNQLGELYASPVGEIRLAHAEFLQIHNISTFPTVFAYTIAGRVHLSVHLAEPLFHKDTCEAFTDRVVEILTHGL